MSGKLIEGVNILFRTTELEWFVSYKVDIVNYNECNEAFQKIMKSSYVKLKTDK